jgi:hypothetical protein
MPESLFEQPEDPLYIKTIDEIEREAPQKNRWELVEELSRVVGRIRRKPPLSPEMYDYLHSYYGELKQKPTIS